MKGIAENPAPNGVCEVEKFSSVIYIYHRQALDPTVTKIRANVTFYVT